MRKTLLLSFYQFRFYVDVVIPFLISGVLVGINLWIKMWFISHIDLIQSGHEDVNFCVLSFTPYKYEIKNRHLDYSIKFYINHYE